MSAYDVSPSSLRPLFDTFWSGAGWRTPPATVPSVDRARAERAGVMFEKARSLSHDGWVRNTIDAVSQLHLASVAEAFAESLTTRRLDLRSALGSFAVARHLKPHRYAPAGSGLCAICGLRDRDDQDLNILNFERFKWGGTRRDDLRYVSFDLEQFPHAPRVAAGGNSLEALRNVLGSLRLAEPSTSVPQAAKTLAHIPGNVAERTVVLEILGVCGVLETPGHPSYLDQFIPYAERELPNRRFVDTKYPACWWTAGGGLNAHAIKAFFPEL